MDSSPGYSWKTLQTLQDVTRQLVCACLANHAAKTVQNICPKNAKTEILLMFWLCDYKSPVKHGSILYQHYLGSTEYHFKISHSFIRVQFILRDGSAFLLNAELREAYATITRAIVFLTFSLTCWRKVCWHCRMHHWFLFLSFSCRSLAYWMHLKPSWYNQISRWKTLTKNIYMSLKEPHGWFSPAGEGIAIYSPWPQICEWKYDALNSF